MKTKALIAMMLLAVLVISGCCCCPGGGTTTTKDECVTSYDCNYGEACDDGRCVKAISPF